MMNSHEQRMCEMQAEFFELSTYRFKSSSYLFVSRFMNSDIAKQLDKIDDPYNFISPNNLIDLMSFEYKSLTIMEGYKIPAKVMRWIGYIYRAWSILKKKESSAIYKMIKSQQMEALYDSFHTFSPEYCIERLEEIANENNKNITSDYEIFKRIYLEKEASK